MNCDLDACYEAAVAVAKQAAVMIKEAYKLEKRIETKASAADLVTETDQQVEKLVISTLKAKFPTHSFIGEESVAAGEKTVWTDDPTWMIDPIDGTTNFVHRFPFSCISIALTVNKKTEIGVIYNPILDHMYTGRSGKGAFCNGERLQVSSTDDLSQSLICAEFGSDRDPQKMESKINTMRRIIQKCHGQLGSAALEVAMVAAGNLDGFFNHGIHCWDYAAASLMVTEAGGVVLDTTESTGVSAFLKIRSVGSCALAMSLIAGGNAEAYYESGVHCWDLAAGEVIVREAGGVVLDIQGGPVDLMARRLLCASSEKLAKQLVQLIEPVEYERD